MPFCHAQWLFIIMIVLLGSVHLLTSCGQKGDLYFPDAEPITLPAPNASDIPQRPEPME